MERARFSERGPEGRSEVSAEREIEWERKTVVIIVPCDLRQRFRGQNTGAVVVNHKVIAGWPQGSFEVLGAVLAKLDHPVPVKTVEAWRLLTEGRYRVIIDFDGRQHPATQRFLSAERGSLDS